MKNKSISITMTAILLLSVFAAGLMPASAAVTTTVSRSLSSPTVAAGSSVTVSLLVTVAAQKPSGVIITDTVPTGWTATYLNNGTGNPANFIGGVKWAFIGSAVQTQTITYILKAPAGAVAQVYTLVGTVTEGTDSASISGTTQITVQAGGGGQPSAAGQLLPRIWNETRINSTTGQVERMPVPYTWNPYNFDGFFYDIKDDLGKEQLVLYQNDLANNQRVIAKSNLLYSTQAQPKWLKVADALNLNDNTQLSNLGLEQAAGGKAFDQGNYWILGWQADRYVALNGKVDKLSKLILEQGKSAAEKKTMTVGETWEVGDGWTLTANSIDAKASPRQVWLTLSKDGVKKDDKVISSGATGAMPIYTFVEKSLAGETDVPIFVTYVDSVFAGTTTDMVQLRYTWLISESVTKVSSSDTYGVFKDANVDSTKKTISLQNTDTTVTLTKDSIQDLMGNMKFQVADSDTLRFMPISPRTLPGTYETRGAIWNETAAAGSIGGTGKTAEWNPYNFAGFFYDIKDDLGKEKLVLLQNDLANNQRVIAKSNLLYSTQAQPKWLKVADALNLNDNTKLSNLGLEQAAGGKAFDQGNYWILGWQADRYVALNGKVDKLSKLILEQGKSAAEKKTMTVGETWEVGDGWTLTANSIDAKASPRQVWLTLSKDGVKKDDKVISSGATGAMPIYTFVEKSLAGETDVPIFVTYVDSVFAGTTSDMVQLRYTWLISESVTKVSSSDTYGVFKDANVDSTTKKISLQNTDTTVTLTKDSIQDLMGNMKFRVADSDTLRFYPMVEYTIAPEGVVVTPTPTVTVTPTVTPLNVTRPPVNVTVTGTPVTTVNVTVTPKKTEPGFEAIFAIAGLLAVAFLVLRQRK